MTIEIVIDVSGESAGSPGVAREFVYGKIDPTPPTVTCSLDDDTGITSYFWEFISQPVGASAVFSSSSVPAPTFTPTVSVPGTYLIRCTVNGGEDFNTNALAFSTENRAIRKPAPGETTQFSDTRGWDIAMSNMVDTLDGLTVPEDAVDIAVDNSGWVGGPFEAETDVQEALDAIIDEIARTTYDGTVQLLDSATSPGMPETAQIDIGEIDKGTVVAVQFSLTSGASTDTDLQFYDGDPDVSGVLLKEFLGLDLVSAALDDNSIWYVGLQAVGDLWVSVTNNTGSDSVYSLRLRINAFAADNIAVDNSGWGGNLGSEEDVQAALDTIDGLSLGGGSPGGSGVEIQYRSDGSTFGGAAKAYWDSTAGCLVLGDYATSLLSAPYYGLQVASTSTVGINVLLCNTAQPENFPFAFVGRARGTFALPTAVQTNDVLGGYRIGGVWGTTWAQSSSGVAIEATAAQAWGAGPVVGTRLAIKTVNSAQATLADRYVIDGSSDQIWYGAGTSPTEAMRLVGSTGRLGFGLTNPDYVIETTGTTTATTAICSTRISSSVSDCGTIFSRRGRGTVLSKTPVAAGDNLGKFMAGGYYNSTWSVPGEIIFEVAGVHGTYLSGDFKIRLVDSTNTFNEVARFKSTKRLGIGTDSPGGTLGLLDATTYITRDGSNNLSFTDAVTGTKTLAQLAASGGSPGGTTPQLQYNNGSGGFAATTNVRYDSSDGVLIAGAYDASPWSASTYGLHVMRDGYAGINISAASITATDVPILKLTKTHGASHASPGIIQSGDDLGRINFDGTRTAAWNGQSIGVMLLATASETWNTGATGTLFDLKTATNGTIAAATRYKIEGNGDHVWNGAGASPTQTMRTDADKGALILGSLTASPFTSSGYLAIAAKDSAYGGYCASIASETTDQAPTIYFLRSRGASHASPALVTSTYRLGALSFSGTTSSAWSGIKGGVLIAAEATETWSGSVNGAALQFHTVTNTGTTLYKRYEIEGSGDHVWYGGGSSPPELMRLDASAGALEIPAPSSAHTPSKNATITISLDESGHNLIVTAKYSGGTSKTATIAFD